MKIFNQNPPAKVKKSKFDLSHEKKLSMGMGKLYPVLVQEVVPGDKFNIDTQSMIRFAPLMAPIMHRINAYVHFFYVPNRILTPNWEKFVVGENVTIPIGDLTNVEVGKLGDYMGLPTGNHTALGEKINTLPFRAYVKIYNDYYRDENLQTEIDMEAVGFDNNIINSSVLPRAWEKDYFTSALPWAQKGNPVTMDAVVNYKDPAETHLATGGLPTWGANIITSTQVGTTNNRVISDSADSPTGLTIENIDSVSIEVEELRRATRLQRWLERNNRSGSRYVEHLLAHWGVQSSDARLQRAEYIGGGKSPVVISEVLNTTGTAELPQGYMAGHGINVGRTNQAYKYCEEHGFIIGIMSVMPEPSYQQGLPKLFSRLSNLDFYYPEFAQLGEQPVLNKEIYFGTDGDPKDGTFGYQSRYAEYKFNTSSVHGAFRDDLEFWHMGRKFSNPPALNSDFIECDPTTRIFAVVDPEDADKALYVQLYHKISAVRPLPYFNDPKL